jgi:hypothetical protein
MRKFCWSARRRRVLSILSRRLLNSWASVSVFFFTSRPCTRYIIIYTYIHKDYRSEGILKLHIFLQYTQTSLKYQVSCIYEDQRSAPKIGKKYNTSAFSPFLQCFGNVQALQMLLPTQRQFLTIINHHSVCLQAYMSH